MRVIILLLACTLLVGCSQATIMPSPTVEPTVVPTVEPTIEPTPTFEPTPITTEVKAIASIQIEPVPEFPCESCEPYALTTDFMKRDGTTAIVYRCPDARLLQNRSEVKQFMQHDQTDKNKFTSTYSCLGYAEDVVHNAAMCGLSAYLGIVYFYDDTAHAFVIFPTPEGNVWVDATYGDWWIELDGNEWHGINMYNESQPYNNNQSLTMWYYIEK